MASRTKTPVLRDRQAVMSAARSVPRPMRCSPEVGIFAISMRTWSESLVSSGRGRVSGKLQERPGLVVDQILFVAGLADRDVIAVDGNQFDACKTGIGPAWLDDGEARCRLHLVEDFMKNALVVGPAPIELV
jgi:hypothetical protein